MSDPHHPESFESGEEQVLDLSRIDTPLDFFEATTDAYRKREQQRNEEVYAIGFEYGFEVSKNSEPTQNRSVDDLIRELQNIETFVDLTSENQRALSIELASAILLDENLSQSFNTAVANRDNAMTKATTIGLGVTAFSASLLVIELQNVDSSDLLDVTNTGLSAATFVAGLCFLISNIRRMESHLREEQKRVLKADYFFQLLEKTKFLPQVDGMIQGWLSVDKQA